MLLLPLLLAAGFHRSHSFQQRNVAAHFVVEITAPQHFRCFAVVHVQVDNGDARDIRLDSHGLGFDLPLQHRQRGLGVVGGGGGVVVVVVGGGGGGDDGGGGGGTKKKKK